jgi:hypothetical protein
MNPKTLFIPLALALGLAVLLPIRGAAQEPATGGGIVVDGNPADWDLADDFFADLYNAGRPTPDWPGFAVLAKLYLRYDCDSGLLHALVLDEPGGGLPDADPDEAWIKIYGLGWAGNKLIDGDGNGNTSPRSFEWVHLIPGDPNSPVIGYEASAWLEEGAYSHFEAHLNIDGDTASTGKHAQGHAISLAVTCERDDTVAADEQPQAFRLHPNYPNPFNPSTTIAFTVAETGWLRLLVVDLQGREVATLADGLFAAGDHALTFDATGLASGVYVYRLEAEGLSRSRKLTLVK